MTSDDWKRLLLGPTLFRLDTVIAPRLVPILYALGLLGVLVWAIDHLFMRFATGFGNGLWGLLEIAVYGFAAIAVLRIACEGVLVYFRAHQSDMDEVSRTRATSSLLDEVSEAIHDLAEADVEEVVITEPVHTPPSPRPAPPPAAEPAKSAAAADAPATTRRKASVRRTARRAPRTRPESDTPAG